MNTTDAALRAPARSHQGPTRIASPLAALAERWHLLGMGVLLLAAVSSQAPPTALGIANPDSYQSIWSIRVGPINLFELGLGVVVLLWALQAAPARLRGSRLDKRLSVAVLLLAGLQLVAVPLNREDADFVLFDLERLAVPLATYFVATRAIQTRKHLRMFTTLLCVLLAAHAVYLVVRYGLIGSTGFGVVLGSEALLITEDALLVLLPATVAWGLLVDRQLGRAGQLGTLALVGLSLIINLLSLRRGATLFLAASVGVRSLSASRRAIFAGLAVVVSAGAILLMAGPWERGPEELRYTLESAVLQSEDDSTSQRSAELENFAENMTGADWLIGRGIGVIWRAQESAPTDIASFGSRETAFNRIGWHVYGLDWAYKLGLLGIAIVFAFLVSVLGLIRRAHRIVVDPYRRSVMFSLAVCLPVLGLFAFTNLRVACFAGIVLGLLSRLLDEAGGARAT